jgi:hypothetical protein
MIAGSALNVLMRIFPAPFGGKHPKALHLRCDKKMRFNVREYRR